ncbi:MAG TPA: type II toxin-antitoxin system RelE/ParE family toxin [Candidatus Babeliales bacterium]|nr:type II toxin-antitoxin system RelE/ParE family toxin [Candidatus Babeliales bacterium]
MVVTKPFDLRFYQETSGKEPVLEWINDFNEKDLKTIGLDIKEIQYSWPWKMPLVKPLGNGLMEMRTKLKDKQIRIFFTLHKGEIILLHGFIKKTQKTPKNELEIALKRMKQTKQK